MEVTITSSNILLLYCVYKYANVLLSYYMLILHILLHILSVQISDVKTLAFVFDVYAVLCVLNPPNMVI